MNIAKYIISSEKLLNKEIIPNYDFHIHTKYTDGKASVFDIVNKAIEFKLEAIAFTEHTEKWRNNNSNWKLQYLADIEKIKFSEKRLNIFTGFEANAIDLCGNIELSDELIEKSDFILGAVHRYPGIGDSKITNLSKNKAMELEYLTSMALINSKKIHSLAHVGATCSKYVIPFPIALIKEIIKEAVRNNVAIEINPVYHKPLLNFIELCAEEKAFVTLGSNAHGLNDIGLITREVNKILHT